MEIVEANESDSDESESIKKGARGQGSADIQRDRPAFHEHDPEGVVAGSMSNERTFREDVSDPRSIESMLSALCERVCWRARKRVPGVPQN